MIIQKEFYFIRHGQTDGNAAAVKQDHGDISLNAIGRAQARMIEPIVASLPVKTICFSPLKRAKETRDIACTGLTAAHAELTNLSECNTQIWNEMTALGKHAIDTSEEPVYSFMQRVLKGINEALSFQGPVLIIAHGGIHWAACCLMEIDRHDWIIDNCIVTQFSIGEDGHWMARKLNEIALFNEINPLVI